MNIPPDTFLWYRLSCQHIGENYYAIYFDNASGDNIYHWKPDNKVKIIYYSFVNQCPAGDTGGIDIYIDQYDMLFDHHQNAVLAVPFREHFVQHFTERYIYPGSDVVFNCSKTGNNVAILCLYVKELLPEIIPDYIHTKCGLIDWLRGECVHGIVG